jgi:hypothetical protein
MSDYTKLSYQLKRKIGIFSKKISVGLSRPKYKFIFQMLYGLAEAQSVLLSEISRALKEPITLKKTIDRLSRNLNSFSDRDLVFSNYLKVMKKECKSPSVLVIDNSDIIKNYSEKQEFLCQIKDGSSGEIGNGYRTLDITALSQKEHMPLPVYTRIYSSTEDNFISEDTEILEGLKFLSKHYGKAPIRTLDRGYDANVYIGYFTKRSENFIVRLKSNRNVIFKDKTVNVLDLANRYKGKYLVKFKDKKGKMIESKITSLPVKLPAFPDKQFYLTVVYGFGRVPMLLLSNLQITDKILPTTIMKVYLMRWRIEEYFRFKKQQFSFENIRVQSIESIRTINLLLTVLIGLIGLMSEDQIANELVCKLIVISERIHEKANFIYYAIGDGIFTLLKKTRVGIREFLIKEKSPPSPQLTLFKSNDYEGCWGWG